MTHPLLIDLEFLVLLALTVALLGYLPILQVGSVVTAGHHHDINAFITTGIRCTLHEHHVERLPLQHQALTPPLLCFLSYRVSCTHSSCKLGCQSCSRWTRSLLGSRRPSMHPGSYVPCSTASMGCSALGWWVATPLASQRHLSELYVESSHRPLHAA
jgi:hypothetical protein